MRSLRYLLAMFILGVTGRAAAAPLTGFISGVASYFGSIKLPNATLSEGSCGYGTLNPHAVRQLATHSVHAATLLL